MRNAELVEAMCVNTFAHSGTRYTRDPRVWRYMDLLSLISLLHREELHFTPLADLAVWDVNEGTGGLSVDVVNSPIPPSILVYPPNEAQELRNQEEIKRVHDELSIPLADNLPRFKAQVAEWDSENSNVHISCWHTNEIESDFMWRVYAKQEYGFAIVSSAQSLVRSLLVGDIEGRKIGFGFVVYPTRDQVVRQSLDRYLGSTAAFMVKHPEFAHENEFRVFVRTREPRASCSMKVCLRDLVHAIRLSPLVPNWAEEPLLQTLNPICEQKGIPLVGRTNTPLRDGSAVRL